MTGTSASDKSGKNKKGVPLATVKEELASSSPKSCMKREYEMLKENHETLKIDYASLQKRVKLSEETYEITKKLLQSKAEGLDKYKAKIDSLRKREEELVMATRKGKEDAAKLENKFVALAQRFGVIEADCSYLESLYDAEVAAASPLGETENLVLHGGNNNVKNDVTDQCKNQEIFTPRAVTNHSPSSSSSSSDGSDVVFKLPDNWPEWAMPKDPRDDSSKS